MWDVSVTSPIRITDRLCPYTIRRVTLMYISRDINALFWLFVRYTEKIIIVFNEMERNETK